MDVARLRAHQSEKLLVLIFFSPSLHTVALIRAQEAAGRLPILGRIFRRMIWYVASTLRGCEVDFSANIGPGLRLPHPMGVVIGPYQIGSNSTLMQHVTIGVSSRDSPGAIRLGDNVMVGAGAKILGNVTIGDDAIIGANAVVLTDVPAGHTAVGVPARVFPNKTRVC